MQLTIKSDEREADVTLNINDERRELNNLLSMLDSNAVSELELSDLKGDRIPRAITGIAGLHTLTFRRCHALRGIPSELKRCAGLKKLSFIQCADFYDLRGIASLGALESLHVSGCDCFDTLPDEIRNMSNLKAFELSCCTSVAWLDLDILPESLRLLDIHGDVNAEFDDSAADHLHLASVQIQDETRIASLGDAPLIHNIASLLRKSIQPSTVGSMDGGGD